MPALESGQLIYFFTIKQTDNNPEKPSYSKRLQVIYRFIKNNTSPRNKQLFFGIFLVFIAITGIYSHLSGNSNITNAEVPNMFENNIQNMKLLSASVVTATQNETNGVDDTVYLVDSESNVLIAQDGPGGTLTRYTEEIEQGEIATYIVQSGDTLSEISRMFKVSVNTIRWHNNIDRNSNIKIGQTLVILPVDGVLHKVEKNDTVSGIAKKYNALIDDIIEYNNIEGPLMVGYEIVVPGGEVKEVVKVATSTPSSSKTQSNTPSSSLRGIKLIHPTKGKGRVSRGPSVSHKGLDVAVPVGTPIYASADGIVSVSYNGCTDHGRGMRETCGQGFGNWVGIKHTAGPTTISAHMSRTTVRVGQRVKAGDLIGYSGNTGRSSGPHLHFEMRKLGSDDSCSQFGQRVCR